MSEFATFSIAFSAALRPVLTTEDWLHDFLCGAFIFDLASEVASLLWLRRPLLFRPLGPRRLRERLFSFVDSFLASEELETSAVST